MAQLNFGGTIENVVIRDEFPLEKAREVLKDETIAVIGYGVQGPGQATVKVYMERFRHKLISSYFIFFTHYSCRFLLSLYFASRPSRNSFTRSKQLVVIATRPERTNCKTQFNTRSSP